MRNKVQIYANSVEFPSSFHHVKRGGETCPPGGAESSGEGCHRNLFTRSKSIHLHHFYHPEEGWGEKVSGRHARTESVCGVSSIQDGGYITTERYPPERGLHDKAGSSSCLLDYSVGPKSKIFLRFFWKSVLYQFTCLPFDLSLSARLFTKTLKLVIAFLRSMGIRPLIFLDNTTPS